MRMEDSIIFNLVERSQYRVNEAVYKPNYEKLGEFRVHQLRSAGSNGCLGDWFLYQAECLHSQVRRYLHPTEYAFFGPLPEPTLHATLAEDKRDRILHTVPKEAVVNQRLLEIYREKMVPKICDAGDDGNYGSVAVQDVVTLQTMATRIYFGLFVAESKFRAERAKAEALIKARDREGLMAFITKPEVEARNIQRVILKTKTFSQDIDTPNLQDEGDKKYKIDADYVGAVFRDYLMPLTKDVEVEYLLARLDPSSPESSPSVPSALPRPLSWTAGRAEEPPAKKAKA